jgi:hypothetical protein
VHGLEAMGVKAMSIISVEGLGALADPQASELSLSYVTNYSEEGALTLDTADV